MTGGRLDGKVPVITGGTSGIGAATARRLSAEGARDVIVGRSVDKGESLATEIGEHAVFHAADVAGEAAVASIDRPAYFDQPLAAAPLTQARQFTGLEPG